jgi:UDP-glucose 4-epimerase
MSDIKKKRILVVGGSGYLGSHLKSLLSYSYHVSYTSRVKSENSIQFDLMNKETFQNLDELSYDCILILASTMEGLGTAELKDEYLNVNILGLSTFLQFISDRKLTNKLLFISSMTVYGTGNTIPVGEEGSLNPLSTYGLSKLIGEKIVEFYCRSRQANGVIMRIPGIYGGSRTSGYVYNTALKCIKHQPVEIDVSTLGYWETINIDDLCNWIGEFIENYDWNKKMDSFNISYGRGTDIIECAYSIKEMLHSKSEIIITGKKGYIDFYLDNTKVKRYVRVKDCYLESLEQYVQTIQT